MSTATKLEYLNTTKEKIRDSINLTGANIGTSDTFRSYATKLKLGLIDIINNGIDTLYNNFPKVSGIGSNLSLTPTYEAPMKLNEIQGDTLQDGTPTPDSPVEIQSVTGLQNVEIYGKNLFDINGTVTQGTLDKYNNGFTLIKGTNRRIRFVLPKVLPAGTYTLSYDAINVENVSGNYFFVSCQYTNTNIGILNNIILNDSGATFTTTSEFDRLYFFIADNQDDTATITIDNVQLEKGSTATDYEPYKGNTYEVNLGKNLVDFSNLQTNNNTTYTWQNNILEVKATTGTYSRASIDITNLYKNNPNKSIRFDYDSIDFSQGINPSVHLQIVQNGTNNYVVLVDTDGSITTRTIPYDTSEITQVVLRIVSNNTNTSQASQISITKPILHFGNIATTYAPYFTPIELNKIGDYQDRIYKDNGKWYVEKQIGKVILDGSTYISTTAYTDLYFIYATALYVEYIIGGYSSHFGFENNSNIINNDTAENNLSDNQIAFRLGNSKDRLYIKSSQFASTTDLKNWLSDNKPIVYYVLATPTYTEITNTELIEDLETLYTAKSQEGTTNISITSEDLEMILNVSALEGDA